jgi:hypothetical protein
MTSPDTTQITRFWVRIGIGACVRLVSLVIRWYSWRTEERWRPDTRVQERMAECRRQASEDRLPPEVRQRLEGQRHPQAPRRQRTETERAAAQSSGGYPRA